MQNLNQLSPLHHIVFQLNIVNTHYKKGYNLLIIYIHREVLSYKFDWLFEIHIFTRLILIDFLLILKKHSLNFG
jgi:hypothetical protein